MGWSRGSGIAKTSKELRWDGTTTVGLSSRVGKTCIARSFVRSFARSLRLCVRSLNGKGAEEKLGGI